MMRKHLLEERLYWLLIESIEVPQSCLSLRGQKGDAEPDDLKDDSSRISLYLS